MIIPIPFTKGIKSDSPSRWQFEISVFEKDKFFHKIKYYLILSFDFAVQYDDGTWHPKCDYYSLMITNKWKFGRYHAYYDGPHDWFNFGPLVFNWSGPWCKRCAGEDK